MDKNFTRELVTDIVNIQADIELGKDLSKYRTIVEDRITELITFTAFLKNDHKDYSDATLDVYSAWL